HPEPAQRANSIEPLDIGFAVQAVIAAGPCRRNQQANFLIVMQSADGHARRLRQLAYPPSTLAHRDLPLPDRGRYNLTQREVQEPCSMERCTLTSPHA